MDRPIETANDLQALLVRLEGEPVIGLDTEFVRERSYFPRLALLQLRWSSGRALVDPLAVDVRPLAKLLESPSLFVVHASTQDLEILEHAVGSVPARLFDTQIAAGFLGYRSPSLDTLLRDFVDTSLDKADQLTDWTRRPLTEDQVRYALSDVECLLDLHRELVSRLASRGRLAWVHEECERLRLRDRRRQEPDTLWWKLKGSRKLSRRSASVAQSLSAYREREAARLDLPARVIFSDMAILAMAQRPPTAKEHVRNVRGLDVSRLSTDRVSGILEAVQVGIDLPPEALRLPPSRAPRETAPPAIIALCLAWAGQRAEDESLDPALLATRDHVEAFASGRVDPELWRGFRWDILGQDLERILQGEALIVVADQRLRLVEKTDA